MKKLICAVTVLAVSTAQAGTILFVDEDAPPNGDGLSWNTAFRYLQDALVHASVPANGVNEVRVAQGMYLPDRDEANPSGTGARAATFQLISGVDLLGGYAGLGAPDPDVRDPDQYETTLNGDIAGDDDTIAPDACCIPHETPGCSDAACEAIVCDFAPPCCTTAWDGLCVRWTIACQPDADCPQLHNNAYHVVTSAGAALIDGFTITRGRAENPEPDAGGLLIPSGNPTISNCRFVRNICAGSGGAIRCLQGTPLITSCVFDRNVSMGNGGAIQVDQDDLVVIGCEFTGNGGGFGGAMFLDGELTDISFCSFKRNGGSNGGAILCKSVVTVSDCSFEGNYAEKGGAILTLVASLTLRRSAFYGNSAFELTGGALQLGFAFDTTVTNCTFSGNTAENAGGAIDISSDQIEIRSCTIVGNSTPNNAGGIDVGGDRALISDCIIWGNTDGSGDVEHAQIVVGGSQVFEFELTFSCVEGFSTLGGYGNIATDPMIVDADGPDDVVGTDDDDFRLADGSPAVNTANPVPPPGLGMADVRGLPRIQECRLDMGALESPLHQSDCNNNGRADECDLAQAQATDCNANGVLDECDIAFGTDSDCNANGLPDGCDLTHDLYRVDDGSEDLWIQGSGGDLIWFNEFRAVSDGEVIVAVDICWGDIEPDNPTDIAVWIDPNNDGNPIDAVLVTLVEGVLAVNAGTGLFNTIPIPPTAVGDTGDYFYVGAHVADAPFEAPACVDRTLPRRRKSWGVIGDNLEQLWNNTLPPTILDDNCPECSGNWLIRARRAGSQDADENGIPDECVPGDLDGDGFIGITDFLLLLSAWGPCPDPCPPSCNADLDGDCNVGITDFLILLGNWG